MPVSLVLDFRTADLRTRERFHLGEERAAALYAEPVPEPLSELVVVSTCNRVEVYGAAEARAPDTVARASHALARLWTEGDDARGRDLLRTAAVRAGPDAARHLLRVASGLESQVLGDVQVLGQVRRAYRAAAESGAAGPVLHRLFETALRAGKRVVAETSLSGMRHSVGTEAAVLASRRLGPLESLRCVIVGCGKTGEHAARRLAKLGAGEIVLVNRSPGRAVELAAEVGGRAAPWETLHQELARADAALVATAADVPPVRASSLAHCRRSAGRDARTLLVLDLAMPRNVEPEVAGLDGVTLLDLDALRIPLSSAEEARRDAIPAAERIVDAEVARFAAWHGESAARRAVAPLREALEEVCRRELAFSAGPDAGRTAERIVAKLLARPMATLRAASARGEPLDAAADLLRSLFTPAAAATEPEQERPRLAS
jgi:glutamyl-tRNA reductase